MKDKSKLTIPKTLVKPENVSPQDVLLEHVSVIEERIWAYPMKIDVATRSSSIIFEYLLSSVLKVLVFATIIRVAQKRIMEMMKIANTPNSGLGPIGQSLHLPLLMMYELSHAAQSTPL